MPKTGGTWLRDFLGKNGDRNGTGHNPVRRLEKLYPNRYQYYGTIRDPWSWYVSLHNHAQRSVQGKANIQRYGGTFPSFLQIMAKKGIKDEGYTLISVRSDEHLWKDFPQGLYSHWFEIFYMPHVKTFIDTAQLYQGVEELLGIKADPKVYPVLNASTTNKKPAEDRYTQDLIDLVWETDGELAERLGFSPFSASSKGAVIRL